MVYRLDQTRASLVFLYSFRYREMQQLLVHGVKRITRFQGMCVSLLREQSKEARADVRSSLSKEGPAKKVVRRYQVRYKKDVGVVVDAKWVLCS